VPGILQQRGRHRGIHAARECDHDARHRPNPPPRA
jgi:hypothetical protein